MSILSDINLKLPLVDSNDDIVIYDTEVVKQNLIELVSTEEGEIYYSRAFGLNLKQFLHYPLVESTALMIESYITSKIADYETNVTYLDASSRVVFDIDNNALKFYLAYKINLTGEIMILPVPVLMSPTQGI